MCRLGYFPEFAHLNVSVFFIYTNFLYNKIREAGAHIVRFIDGISVYKCARAIDKNKTILSKVLQVCHEWT